MDKRPNELQNPMEQIRFLCSNLSQKALPWCLGAVMILTCWFSCMGLRHGD